MSEMSNKEYELSQYKELLDEGIITQEEFDNKKKQLSNGQKISGFDTFICSKKGVAIILSTLGVIAAVAIVIALVMGSGSGVDSKSDSTPSTKPYSNNEIESDTIELLVKNALYTEVSKKYSSADPSSCRYSINKKEKGTTTTVVYGSVTLYDKYGDLVSSKKTDPFKKFEVTINNSTYQVVNVKFV